MNMKIVSKSIGEQVYDLIKNQILSGKLQCGSKISEESLASLFGVSRTPVREALKKLSVYGLIQMEPRSHSSVISLSEKESSDIASFRVYLEDFFLENFKIDKLDSSLTTLSRYANDCERALKVGDRAKVFELDSLFHTTLANTSENTAAINTYERLDAKIQLLRITQNEKEDELLYYLKQHKVLLELLENRKIDEAKALMYEHIIHDKGSVK